MNIQIKIEIHVMYTPVNHHATKSYLKISEALSLTLCIRKMK